MRFDDNGGETPNFEPNSFSGPLEDLRYRELPYKVSGDVNRFNHREGNDDYRQALDLFRLMKPDEKQRLIQKPELR
jgi:catalase